MSNFDNLEFFLNLNNLYLSDWVNYPPISYDNYPEDKITNIIELLSLKIYKIYFQIINKKHDLALILINQLENTILECTTFNFFFDIQLAKTDIFMSKFQMSNALQNLKEIEISLMFDENYNSSFYVIRKVRFYKLLSIVFNELKQTDQALDASLKGINLSEKYKFDHKTYEFYTYNSVIYRHLGDIQKANESVLKASDIAYMLNDIQKQISCLNSLGTIAQIDGDSQKAFDYANKSLSLARQFNSPSLEHCLINSANCHWRFGYLTEVLPLLKESEVILKKQNNKRGLFTLYNNIGLFYVTKGDYHQALQFLELALQMNLETKYDVQLPYIYTNLSSLYYEINDLRKAETYSLKALEFSEKTKNVPFQVKSLMLLISYSCLLGNREKILVLFEKLSDVIKSSTAKIDKINYELANGIILTSSENLQDISCAINKFKTIMEDKTNHFEVKHSAYLYFCRSIFKRYLLFQVEIDWNLIKQYSDSMEKQAKDLNLFNTYFSMQILISKLFMLKENFQTSEIIISNVLNESRTRGFDFISNMAKMAQIALNSFKIGVINVKFDSNKSKERKLLMEKDIIDFIGTFKAIS